MIDETQYAVYLHENALEALGPAVTPYVTQGPGGPHFVCTDLDTGGALCEMVVETVDAEGNKIHTEVMVPVAMIRLVLSIGSISDNFGFHPTTNLAL